MTEPTLPLRGLRVGVFGLGEAGTEVAGGLAAAGAQVVGYDPAGVATPAGVERVDDAALAASGASLVVAVTSSADSPAALTQALDAHAQGVVPEGSIYADLATPAPSVKQALANRCTGRFSFVDVALMTTAPGRGLAIPSLASGPGAGRYAELLGPAGAPIEVVSDQPGQAATRKLLRSIAIKGLAGVVMESLDAAEAAGLRDVTWANLVGEFTAMDESFLQRLVDGTPLHAERRFHEMETAEQLMRDLDVEPIMTPATIASLDRLRTNARSIPNTS